MDPYSLESDILVKAIRGTITECVHRGHIAVITSDRTTVAYAGNPEHVTFARSTAKPLQAIPLLEENGAEHYHLNEKQIALLCSSHNGEDHHASLALATLQGLALEENALACGIHEPYHKPTADRLKASGEALSPIRNNCSGKHTGMLALALLHGWPTDRYIDPQHPVQQRMLRVLSELTEIPEEQIPLGTDGCGVPVFALPISALAYAFAKLGRPAGLPEHRARACKLIVESIAKEPYYVAGSGRFDTRLVEVTRGRIIGKMGAEGMFALTVPEHGIGIAVKIEDGAMRALYPAVVETLVQLELLGTHEIKALQEFHTPCMINHQGMTVGRLQPVLKLHSANQRP